MKLVASKESYKIIELDKEAIKAIRFCCGFTPDLRKQFNVCRAMYNTIYDFIWDNRGNVIGMDFACTPNYASNEFDKLERLVGRIAHCVCKGITVKGV